GIILAHNGNLTNAPSLRVEMAYRDRRHINTSSDTEVLLNVLADELQKETNSAALDEGAMFNAVTEVTKRVKGSYAVVSLIAGYGLLAFRDPFGIRPLCIGRIDTPKGPEWMIASESVALEGLGFTFVRDVNPGEAIYIDIDGNFYSRQCVADAVLTPCIFEYVYMARPDSTIDGVTVYNVRIADAVLTPCIFEYVYMARPDSTIDGVTVYNVRMRMGDYLAEKIRKETIPGEIDVVMPIPDSSRPAAMQVAKRLGVDYREGFFKNRYIGRTFIMPGQAVRKKSVRQKLNAMRIEFKDKTVLIVDDSIVRGTTSFEIVQMARESGAKKVIFASAAPPVRFPNVYGIDMPTRSELVAYGRTDEEINKMIGADQLIYQSIEDMKQAVKDVNPNIQNFEASCFDGHYIT
ncbi:MAG: amidophosphoribosyltransferase, partial [Polynucleobacter sp. 35-46-207]